MWSYNVYPPIPPLPRILPHANQIVVKGVMTAEDAAESVRQGVDGIWVSNHGARQLDTTPATIEVLPEVCVHAILGLPNDTLAGRVCVIRFRPSDKVQRCPLMSEPRLYASFFSGRWLRR